DDQPDCVFQAEDGLRDRLVTGVQTCALPISRPDSSGVLRLETRNEAIETHYLNQLELLEARGAPDEFMVSDHQGHVVAVREPEEIGRASCRERVEIPGCAVARTRNREVTP